MEKSQLAAGSFFVPGDLKEKRERVRNTQPPLFTMRVALYVAKATCAVNAGGFLVLQKEAKSAILYLVLSLGRATIHGSTDVRTSALEASQESGRVWRWPRCRWDRATALAKGKKQ